MREGLTPVAAAPEHGNELSKRTSDADLSAVHEGHEEGSATTSAGPEMVILQMLR